MTEKRLYADFRIYVKWICPRCHHERQMRIYNWRIDYYRDTLKCPCGCTLLVQEGIGYETPMSRKKFEQDKAVII